MVYGQQLTVYWHVDDLKISFVKKRGNINDPVDRVRILGDARVTCKDTHVSGPRIGVTCGRRIYWRIGK